MARYNTRSTIRNTTKYAAVYDSIEAAEAQDRNGLLTVQAFDSGDFPLMKSLDSVDWEDGDLVEADGQIVTFVVRIQSRKPDAPVDRRRNWKAGASDAIPS